MKKLVVILLAVLMVASVFVFAACSAKPAPAAEKPAAEKPAAENPMNSPPLLSLSVSAGLIVWTKAYRNMLTKPATNPPCTARRKPTRRCRFRSIQDLIAKKVDAICIVPFSPEAVEPVLKQAMEKGIVVIGHEADNLVNVDFDIEAFDNYAYGAELMKILGEKMGGKGNYATTVGAVTAKSQNQWEEGGVTYQEKNFPDMKLVERKIETYDEQKKAEEIMTELFKKYPDLTGFQGATCQDAPGAAAAVEKAGLIGKVHVVGTCLSPSQANILKAARWMLSHSGIPQMPDAL